MNTILDKIGKFLYAIISRGYIVDLEGGSGGAHYDHFFKFFAIRHANKLASTLALNVVVYQIGSNKKDSVYTAYGRIN